MKSFYPATKEGLLVLYIIVTVILRLNLIYLRESGGLLKSKATFFIFDYLRQLSYLC